MGTMIELQVGGMSLDWSKNLRGSDHGMLFQEKDRKRFHSDQIDYDYFAKNGEDPGEMEMGFTRTLQDVVSRLELLGFTMEHARREYDSCAAASRDEILSYAEFSKLEPTDPNLMSFEEFVALSTRHPIASLNDSFISGTDSASEKDIQGRFAAEDMLRRIPRYEFHEWDAYSERSHFGHLINILHPYSVLRILADNSANLTENVQWQYGPLVDSGWADVSEFIPGARRNQTFLVATEGSSDAHILKHAIPLLMPGISDFFRFIDVSDRHPFPGTGNLTKFAEGLAKIDVHNQVIFLFDNDAEGCDAHRRVSGLNLPTNMRAMLLPDLEEFRSFPAKGPEGVNNADINGRAAAIECYLDLNLPGFAPPTVVWTNYKKEADVYQGSLEQKEAYTKEFLRQDVEAISSGAYNTSKLGVILNALVHECSSMATEVRTSQDEP